MVPVSSPAKPNDRMTNTGIPLVTAAKISKPLIRDPHAVHVTAE